MKTFVLVTVALLYKISYEGHSNLFILGWAYKHWPSPGVNRVKVPTFYRTYKFPVGLEGRESRKGPFGRGVAVLL